MIHREAWYKECRKGDEIAAEIFSYPEDDRFYLDHLWRDLLQQVIREGRLPPVILKDPEALDTMITSDPFQNYLRKERFFPSPLHEQFLFHVDLSLTDTQDYLISAAERLSEEGNAKELETLEDRIDEAVGEGRPAGSGTLGRDTYDRFIFVARLISWGMPWNRAEDVLRAFSDSMFYHVGPHGSLRDWDSLFDFEQAADFDLWELRRAWEEGLNPTYPGEGGFSAEVFKSQNENVIDIWDTFSVNFGGFSNQEFWQALYRADEESEIRQVMAEVS